MRKNLRFKVKKISKYIAMAILAILFIILIAVIYIRIILPNKIYSNALNFMASENYSEAIKEFGKIEEYKDSNGRLDECKKLYKYSQMSDVLCDGAPGNIIENYGCVSSHWHNGLPFIAEFTHDDVLYTIYTDDTGINIVSTELNYKKTLPDYECPNVYNAKLYCYNSETKKIVSMDIKQILCDLEQETVLYDIEFENIPLSYGFIFVNNDKILIRNGSTVILTDLDGNKIREFSDQGLEQAVMKSKDELAYISKPNAITILNFETFKKRLINIESASDEVDRISAYSDGKYYLTTNILSKDIVYDEESGTTQKSDRNGVINASYKDYYIGTFVLDEYVSTQKKGFNLVPEFPGSINMQTGKRYTIPFGNITGVNFGKDDKMYVCGYDGDYENDWIIYRMDLDCRNVEKIGVVKH